MFGVDTTELLIVALAALVFIGPKELPGAMRTAGRWIGRARAHARHFTAGIENMMREAELEEMEKRWREENERIMREHPVALPYVGAGEGTGATLSNSDEASTTQTSFALSEVEGHGTEGPDKRASTSLGTNEPANGGEDRVSSDDEPTLPLPEPEHHRRELP